jgi:hypothetical protein
MSRGTEKRSSKNMKDQPFSKPPVRSRDEKQFKTDQYVGQKPTGGKGR